METTETTTEVTTEPVEATETVEFDPPSKDLAQRALGKVSFADRLVAYRMGSSVGTNRVDLYSYEQVGEHLGGTRWHDLSDESLKPTLAWVDLARLTTWLEEVIGDPELAAAVRYTKEQAEPNFKAQIEAIGPLLRLRYEQYLSVTETEASEDTEE